MTFNVDNEALKAAMMRHYEEKLAKELRNMFTYSDNEDMQKIWRLYTEEVQQKEEARKESVRDFWQAVMRVVALAIVGYASYKLMTL